MIVCFACCPQEGVIIDLFESLTGQLAADDQVAVLVNEPISFRERLAQRDVISYARPFGLLSRSGRLAMQRIRRATPRALFIWTQHPLAAVPMFTLRRSVTLAWWHEPRHRGQVGWLKALGYLAYELLVIRRADLVLVASDSVRSTVPARYLGKTAVLDLPPLDGFDAPADRFSNAPTDLIFFGTFARHKGLDVLARALELLRSKGITPTARIIGTGDMSLVAPIMHQYAQEHADQIDVINAYLPAADLASAISASSASVFPYLSGAGTATHQICRRLRVPTIASAVGSFVDALGDGQGGVLVAPGDVGELAAAIEQTLHRPARLDCPSQESTSWAASLTAMVSATAKR